MIEREEKIESFDAEKPKSKSTALEIVFRFLILFLTLTLPCYYIDWFADLPFWAYFLIIMAVVAILPSANPITLGVWIWGFVIAVQQPVDLRAILLFIFFPIYVLVQPYVVAIFAFIYGCIKLLIERIQTKSN